MELLGAKQVSEMTGVPVGNAALLASFGYRTGELHPGTPRRVPARRGVALDLKEGERNPTRRRRRGVRHA